MAATKAYDYNKTQQLRADREARLKSAKQITARAKAEERGMDRAEQDAVEAAMNAVKNIDAQLKEQDAAMLKAVLGQGSADNDLGPDGETRYLSLRTPSVKSDLTARFGAQIGTHGMKSLIDDPTSVVPIAMDPQPYRMEQAATSLLEILPAAVTSGPVHRFMRQTQRTNNAAPVAPGAVKPTSVFGLEPVDGRLKVIAHISEAIDKYALQDGPSLSSFVQLEMVDGLHQAVEAQLLSGDGTGENLRGLAHTTGIQTQALVGGSPILTCRSAITAVETLSFVPAWFVLSPMDWQAVETQQLSAGSYVLNAEGSRSGLPVDSAARRLWGVNVAVSTGVPAGTGWLLSAGVASVISDGVVATEWDKSGDSFSRNQMVLRVESRFDLAVQRPLGVVKMTLA